MEVLLDSNFIISCIKKKIDFISQIEEQGFKILLPLEVYQELKDLKQKVSHEDKNAIETAMLIFEQKSLQRIRIGKKSVDQGLIDMGRKGYYIATLDAGIKNSIPNKIVIFNAQNRIGVE